MSFVVEDGTGRSDATALAGVAECSAFHLLRGNGAWAGTTSQMEAAIVQATDHLCRAYAFKGARSAQEQALCWPRTSSDGTSLLYDADNFAVGADVVPAAVREACCELALEAIAGEDLDPALERGGRVHREKVDSIEVEYQAGAPAGKEFRRAQNRLFRAGLIRGAQAPGLERV